MIGVVRLKDQVVEPTRVNMDITLTELVMKVIDLVKIEKEEQETVIKNDIY